MTAPVPFSCKYSPNFAELLRQLDISLAITTYQAGKVIFISARNDEELTQLPRTFHSPMGMTVKGNKLAVATKSEVMVAKNSPELAKNYPKAKDTYDAFFLPMASYYTGSVDMHDIHYGKDGLWAVNTSFSTLCLIDDEFSFTPKWKPSFITNLASEDRCHLNGLAMLDEKPKYISALGNGNTAQSWRDSITTGGIIMDIPSNEIIASGLAMPHSPRIYNGKLYTLLSAAQKLVEVDPTNGKTIEIAHIPGFVRGMTKAGDYLFICTSKLRKNSSTFSHLEIAEKANVASIIAVHLPTGAIAGNLTYLASVDEIYDIQVIKGHHRPNLLNTYTDVHHQALITPDATYWGAEKPKNVVSS